MRGKLVTTHDDCIFFNFAEFRNQTAMSESPEKQFAGPSSSKIPKLLEGSGNTTHQVLHLMNRLPNVTIKKANVVRNPEVTSPVEPSRSSSKNKKQQLGNPETLKNLEAAMNSAVEFEKLDPQKKTGPVTNEDLMRVMLKMMSKVRLIGYDVQLLKNNQGAGGLTRDSFPFEVPLDSIEALNECESYLMDDQNFTKLVRFY